MQVCALFFVVLAFFQISLPALAFSAAETLPTAGTSTSPKKSGLVESPPLEVTEAPLNSTTVEELPKTPRKTILFPIVYYTPETQLAGGLLLIRNFWKEREGRVSNLLAAATYTTRNQSRVYIAPKFYFAKGAWEWNGLLSYSYYPSKFYGRGVRNSTRPPEAYTENDSAMTLGGGRNLVSSLYLRGGLTHERRKLLDVLPDERVAAEVAAVSNDIAVNSLNLSLDWDERDSAESPRNGGFYRTTYTGFLPENKNPGRELSSFQRVRLDLRRYLPLGNVWTGAGQVVLSSMEGELIPFQYLNSIGGGSVMRGFYAGQFRDRALALLQGELRYENWGRWTPAIFAGVARLDENLSALNSATDFFTTGLGVHYLIDEENRTKLRIDMGFTGKESGFYVLLGEAF